MKTAEQTAIDTAARRLVNGFSSIPSDWAIKVAEHIDGDECVSVPMWGTLFKVLDPCDERSIRKLLSPLGPSGLDTIEDLIDWGEEHGYESVIAPLKALALAADDDDDDGPELEEIQQELSDAWGEDGDETYWLASSGWEAVGGTGIMAREFEGSLLLGINGAGYDFYESHWVPLYKALGYGWHQRDNDTTRTVSVPECERCGGYMSLQETERRGAWDDHIYKCEECS